MLHVLQNRSLKFIKNKMYRSLPYSSGPWVMFKKALLILRNYTKERGEVQQQVEKMAHVRRRHRELEQLVAFVGRRVM